jgi:hypothetical protein
MTIEQLFTTYWSQVTLLLVGVGYFIKRGFDQKSKKLEINHSLFQQNRITAVSNFLSAYGKTELMWREIAIYKILSNTLDANQIDSIIWPPLNEMKKSVLELKIYFDKGAHQNFEKMLDGFLSINTKLSGLYFGGSPDLSLIQKSNSFHSFKDQQLKENDALLTEVCEEIREIYKS